MEQIAGRLGIIGIGALLVCAGIFGWNWALNQRGLLQRILPKIVLRGLYVVLGGALIVWGAFAGILFEG